MNKQNFTASTSYPISAQTFDFMQKQINFVSEIARQWGDNVILRQPTAEKTGLCIMNGELLELRYSAYTINYYVVIETRTSIIAHGASYSDARVTRYVIGSDNNVGYSEYKAKEDMVDMTLTMQNQMPVGAIIMWSGAMNAIPSGWALCDGTNNTPDLRNKFVLGAGDEYGVGDYGGEAEHTLTEAEIQHHHISVEVGGLGSAGAFYGNVSTNKNPVFNITPAPHNNMPPYYALAYIIKIK